METKHFVDTHAFLWYLAGSPLLGENAKAILQEPASALLLPATALAEACWIVQRGRVALTISDILTAIDNDPRIVIVPLDRTIIERSNTLTAIGEMHDRQIVATALVFQDQGETVDLLDVYPVFWFTAAFGEREAGSVVRTILPSVSGGLHPRQHPRPQQIETWRVRTWNASPV